MSVAASGSCCGPPVNSGRMSSGREPRARAQSYGPPPERLLVSSEKPQRLDQVKMLFGTGHSDIKETALFVDLRRLPGWPCRRGCNHHEVQHIDCLPFLTLGRMNRRQDQIIFVEFRAAGFGAGRIGRVERHFGEKALAARLNPWRFVRVGRGHRRVRGHNRRGRSRCG